MHPVRWSSALRKPFLGLFDIDLQPVGMILGQQRIVITELRDEAAIARRTGFRHDNRIMRPLLSAAAGQSDLQRHASLPLLSVRKAIDLSVTSCRSPAAIPE